VTAACEVAITEREANGNVVWLKGQHDISPVTTLTQTIATTMMLDKATLVVDPSEVQFIQAATIRVIVSVSNDLLLQPHSLAVRSPSSQGRRVLDLCGLTSVLEDPSVSAPSVDLDCRQR